MRSQRFLTFDIEKCHQSLWWKWWYLADIRTSISLAYIGDIQPPIVGISANKNQESVLVEAFFLSSDGCTFVRTFLFFIWFWWKLVKFHQNLMKNKQVNMNWMKKLSLFGGNWKSQIFKISIGINYHTHKDPKNQVDMFFQLFVYILQQNK